MLLINHATSLECGEGEIGASLQLFERLVLNLFWLRIW